MYLRSFPEDDNLESLRNDRGKKDKGGLNHTFGVFPNQPEQLEEITMVTITRFLVTL